MTPAGPVHFIHLGGELGRQHRRAITTARVHASPRVLWTVDPDSVGAALLLARDGTLGPRSDPLEIRPLHLPAWLRDHPIQLANVKDLFAWRILFDHGGLYLDLDTVSLASVWDLLEHDLLVSTEWPDLSDPVARHPYNSAVAAGRRDAMVLAQLHVKAQAVLDRGESVWGKCGPHLLTDVVAEYRDRVDAAPFGVLSGFRDDTVEADYYDRVEAGLPPLVPEGARVLHLYSSSRPERFLADTWTP